jgi:Na+-transporting NADH:ubiquinone oxidoreductase subunit A
MYLVLPDITSAFATAVKEHIRGYAWAKQVTIPMRYGCDDFAVLARRFGLKRDSGPIWAMRTEGVLAVDSALTSGRAFTDRVISVGGPEVNWPCHVPTVAGYPLSDILENFAGDKQEGLRVVNGGIFRGRTVEDSQKGVDCECRGLTVVAEHAAREFLGFVRPGWGRQSYSGCFLSSLRKSFSERFTTAVRGERRPCISCNFCEEVCPAGIMPHLIHKYLYRDLLEEVEQARVDLCVQCGLCSYVCPSKLELARQFDGAMKLIEQEKEALRQEEAAREEAVAEKQH